MLLKARRKVADFKVTIATLRRFRTGRRVVEAIKQVRRRVLPVATIMAAVALLRKDHLVAVATVAAEARRHQIWIYYRRRDSSYSQVVARRKMPSCSPLFRF